MNWTELLSLIATTASLVLAVVAIWLSFVFFRMSSQLSESTKEAAKGIGASVDRLEKLFDKLYSDTFSMMRDTVSDMRKHIWPADESAVDKLPEQIEKKADEKVAELKSAMEKELSRMLERQETTDHRLSSLHDEMKALLDRAIINSRRAENEARKETMREYLMKTLRQFDRQSPVIRLAAVADALPFPAQVVIAELNKLKNEGLILMEDEPFSRDTQLRLVKI